MSKKQKQQLEQQQLAVQQHYAMYGHPQVAYGQPVVQQPIAEQAQVFAPQQPAVQPNVQHAEHTHYYNTVQPEPKRVAGKFVIMKNNKPIPCPRPASTINMLPIPINVQLKAESVYDGGDDEGGGSEIYSY